MGLDMVDLIYGNRYIYDIGIKAYWSLVGVVASACSWFWGSHNLAYVAASSEG
jgi:hypothetical protein